jgi:hypothetical protein
MKLIEFLAVTNSYHFALRVANETTHKIVDYHTHEYDNYEVINISAVTEVENPSPITHAISVRPLVLVTIKEA